MSDLAEVLTPGQLSIEDAIGSPHRKARTSDPPTSKRAARDAFPRAGKQRHRILTAIAESENGLTYDDVATSTGIRGVSVSTRISELHHAGWIEQDGTRETSAGSQAQVWKASEKALAELAASRVA